MIIMTGATVYNNSAIKAADDHGIIPTKICPCRQFLTQSRTKKKRHPQNFVFFINIILMITNLAIVLLQELCRIKIVINNFVKVHTIEGRLSIWYTISGIIPRHTAKKHEHYQIQAHHTSLSKITPIQNFVKFLRSNLGFKYGIGDLRTETSGGIVFWYL